MACGSFAGDDAGGATDSGVDEVAPNEAQAAEAGADADGAAADAGFAACATRLDRNELLMCADFDEAAGAQVYINGFGSPVALPADRTVAAPGLSAPRAMWSDGLVRTASALRVEGKATATYVKADLDVYVDSYSSVLGDGASPPVDGPLVRVGISPGTCYVDVELLRDALFLKAHCGLGDDAGFYRGAKILTGQLAPGSWRHIALEVNFAGPDAVATVDGVKGTETIVPLNPLAAAGGTPFVEIGEVLGARVGFDNVTAVASQ